MAITTLTTVSSILEKVIAPAIQKNLRTRNVIYDKAKRNFQTSIANNEIYIATRTGRHSGIYTVAEGTEPRVGNSAYAQMKSSIKYLFGTLALTDQAISSTNSDKKAIASALTTEANALKEDLAMDLSRQMNGAGAGLLALANGAGVATATLVVDGNPAGGANGLPETAYLAAGMFISIGGATAVEISSVDSDTQVTLASVQTWADNATIKKADADEIQGLAGLIDDGDNLATVQNILRSANPWAKAFTYDTGGALTEANIISTYLKTQRQGGMKKVLIMGTNMYNKYGSLLQTMKKSRDTREVLNGGWSGLEFMDGSVVIHDPDCWGGYVQIVDLDTFTIAENSKAMEWLPGDSAGNYLRRSPTVRTNWEATVKYYLNLVCLNFQANGRLSGQTA